MKTMTLTQMATLCRNEIDKLSFPVNTEILHDVFNVFKRIASEIVFKGHFDVPGGDPIYPVDIEFYFHQEGVGPDLVKDPVMYHTYDHESDSSAVKRRISKMRYVEGAIDRALPYFALGTFNPHTSGIDFTFENEERKYRASFLIRGYKVGDLSQQTIPNSTFAYDDLLFAGIPDGGTGISWIVDDGRAQEPVACVRQNVYKYEKDVNGEYVKVDKKFKKKKGSDGKFIPSTRNWRFKLKK